MWRGIAFHQIAFEDFDREYDQDEYEDKIAQLVKKVDGLMRNESGDDYDRWQAAIRFLQEKITT